MPRVYGGDAAGCAARLAERNRWRLYLELEEGRVDPLVLPLLSTLWSLGAVTTSSCSGRIAVKASQSLWNKRGSEILVSWHEPIDPKDAARRIEGVLEGLGARVAWLAVEPPIVTLYTADEDSASFIVDAALEAGFKYSCYRRSSCGYYVIVRGEERLDALIKLGGELVVERGALEALLAEANRVLERARRRLAALEERLRAGLSVHVTAPRPVLG